MATRFYLPASGTAPLGSLAVDSQWELSDSLDRRPCDIVKSNTSLTQKSAVWSSTTTQQWVWVQFQSKRLAAGYSWTTSDTVSMVIKVAESVAQVDSHLCYVIRVVSGDGSTIRGTIGSYLTTSSEYPTSLATIATRIHDARTTGASNFSSQAGDRIIIEIGHHGVSPSLATVYHNYGDPSATEDYALTAGLTTDLCPWVELSRDVSFVLSDNQPAYTKGAEAASDNNSAYTAGGLNVNDSQSAYVEGSPEAQPASDNQSAFTQGQSSIADNQNAYTQGSTSVIYNKSAYTKGQASVIDNQLAFVQGQSIAIDNINAYTEGTPPVFQVSDNINAFVQGLSTILDSINAFVQGSLNIISHIDGYTKGSANVIANKSAYTLGGLFVSDNQPAYTEGFATGGDVSDSHSAFVLGLDSGLVPDGDVGKTGVWENELGAQSPLYPSIDEYPTPNDNDYIWHTDPTTGDYYECSLTNPIGNVGDGDVVVFWRGKDKTGLGKSKAHVELRQGSTIVSSGEQILTTVPTTYYFTLTPEQKSSITDWNDLRIRITVIIL